MTPEGLRAAGLAAVAGLVLWAAVGVAIWWWP